MGAAMKRPVVQPTKRERLHDILGRFGDDLITREQFEAMMKDHKLTDDEIDAYCRGELK
jgi:ribosomal protein S10